MQLISGWQADETISEKAARSNPSTAGESEPVGGFEGARGNETKEVAGLRQERNIFRHRHADRALEGTQKSDRLLQASLRFFVSFYQFNCW